MSQTADTCSAGWHPLPGVPANPLALLAGQRVLARRCLECGRTFAVTHATFERWLAENMEKVGDASRVPSPTR